MVACTILRSVGKRKSLREFQARFAGVVYPGNTLVLEMWNMGAPKEGSARDKLLVMEEYIFVVKVEETGKVALSHGRALLRTTKLTSYL